MLTPEEQDAFRESVARVGQRAAQALHQQARSPEAAVAFITHLHTAVDAVVRQASAAGPAPECRGGCAHCCHVRVEATEPEVLRIAGHVASLPATEQEAMRDRLRAHVAAHAPPPRRACSFLANEHCTIYSVRPAACRKAHSLSAAQCAAHADHLPQNLRMVADAEALMTGTAHAYRAVGLAATALELNAAVLAALSDSQALERWFQGGGGARTAPAAQIDGPRR